MDGNNCTVKLILLTLLKWKIIEQNYNEVKLITMLKIRHFLSIIFKPI